MEIKHTNFPRAAELLSKLGMSVWRLFSSVQLAIFLTLVLSAFGLISILLIDVMHSPLFLLAGILLVVNIIICSLNRWKGMIGTVKGGRIRQADEFYLTGSNLVKLFDRPVITEETVSLLTTSLKSYRYRVRTEYFAQNAYMVADRNRYSHISTYLIHLSIVLLIIGFLVGNYFGFRNPSFIVSEGMTREVGYGTNLSLRLESFEDEYWADGTPRDYRSQVIIYEDVREVERGVIRVNHPISYRDTRFYQSSFGPAAVLEVRSAGNKVLYSGGVALPMQMRDGSMQYPMGNFSIPEAGLKIYVVGPELNTSGNEPVNSQIDLGIYRDKSAGPVAWISLDQGEYYDFEGMKFGFIRVGKYSGLQVNRDPGNNLIWIGSGLFLLGLGMVFFLPYRRIWVLVEQGSDGKSRVLIKPAYTNNLNTASEFQKLINKLRGQLTDNE